MINRLNYGVLASKIQTVGIVDQYWQHVFSITLPGIPEIPTNPHTLNNEHRSEASCTGDCKRKMLLLNTTLELTRSLVRSLSHARDRIYRLIPDITSNSKMRQARGLINAVGKLSAFLFGTAVEGDIVELKKLINTINTKSQLAVHDAEATKSMMASFMELENKRIDNIKTVIYQQNMVLANLQSKLLTTEDRELMDFHSLFLVTTEISKYIQLHDDLSAFETGVEALVNGQLSHKLIPEEELSAVIDSVKFQLNTQKLSLIVNSIHDVYALPSFDYARNGEQIIIRLKLPLTRHTEMTAYKLFTFAMPVPGNQNFTTTLRLAPKTILANLETRKIAEIDILPQHGMIESHHIVWHTENDQSCIFAIITNQPNLVHDFCDFSATQQHIEPKIVQITKNVFVLTNFISVNISCDKRNHTTHDIQFCKPCLVELNCGCKLTAFYTKESIIETESCDTNDVNDTVIMSSINLALLQSLYDLSNVTLEADKLFPLESNISLQPLNFKLLSTATQNLLASDATLSFSIKKMAENLKNDSIILHNPTEALLLDFISSRSMNSITDYLTSWIVWSFLITYVIFIVLIICIRKMFVRLRLLNALLTLSALPKASAFNFHIATQPTSTQSTVTLPAIISDLAENVKLLNIIEWVVIISIIVIVVSVVHSHFKRIYNIYSLVVLEFKTDVMITYVTICFLPNASNNFMLHTPLTNLPKFHSFKLFSKLTLPSSNWDILNTANNTSTPIPRHIWLGPLKTKELEHIFKTNEWKVTTLIARSHDLHYSPFTSTSCDYV